MSEENVAAVLETVHTREEAEVLEEALAEMENRLFKKTHDAARLLEDIRLSAKTVDILKQFVATEAASANPVDAHETLATLRKKISELKMVRVELAVEPDPRLIEEISRWVRTNVAGQALVDVGVDRRMLGGARIIFNGRYRQMTLAELVEKILEAEKRTILKELGFQP